MDEETEVYGSHPLSTAKRRRGEISFWLYSLMDYTRGGGGGRKKRRRDKTQSEWKKGGGG